MITAYAQSENTSRTLISNNSDFNSVTSSPAILVMISLFAGFPEGRMYHAFSGIFSTNSSFVETFTFLAINSRRFADSVDMMMLLETVVDVRRWIRASLNKKGTFFEKKKVLLERRELWCVVLLLYLEEDAKAETTALTLRTTTTPPADKDDGI